MSASWIPELAEGPEPLYEKIVASLERDIRAGVVAAGTRLPPQRDLAYSLKLSTGTVTRAYVEAERRGLVRGHVGRGTYVSDLHARGRAAEEGAEGAVDLSVNVIPHTAALRRLASVARRPADLAGCLGYAPPMGLEAHRRSGAAWLARTANLSADWGRIAVTGGAQHAMTLAFAHLVRPGDTVLCEAATFSGVKSLSDHLGFRLRGVALDGEGLDPGDLERAVRDSGARVLYAMPTLQNPTGRTMSRRRRGEIAAILRRHDMWLVEDDNYAIFHPKDQVAPTPLAAALPERAFYIAGASKSLAPGLRTGFLVCPPACVEAIGRAIRATVYAPGSLGPELFSRWVEDGSAFAIVEEVVEEIRARAALAREILGLEAATPTAPHLWLEMPELEAQRAYSRTLRAGAALTPVEAPFPAPIPTAGLRVCLGGAPSRGALEVGLRRLAGALKPQEPALLSV